MIGKLLMTELEVQTTIHMQHTPPSPRTQHACAVHSTHPAHSCILVLTLCKALPFSQTAGSQGVSKWLTPLLVRAPQSARLTAVDCLRAGNEERIVYRASRLTLRNGSAHRLPQPATAGDSNMVTVASFQLGESIFSVANTHLSWQGGASGQLRIEQMRDVCKSVKAISQNSSIFVTGDLNDIFAPLQVAHRQLGLLPSFTQLGITAPHTLPTPAVNPTSEIDYFASKTYDWVLSKGARVLASERLDYQLDGVYPSDHYPVLGTYLLDD